MAIGASVAATGAAVNAVRADRERKRQEKKLKELQKQPRPTYGVTPELQGYYNQASSEVLNPQGFSGAERGAFNQQMGQNYNTQYANAVGRAGGQTGSFINNVLTANNLNAGNQFAVSDANLRRQNRQSAFNRQSYGVGQIQNIDNMNTQADLNYRLMTEQALGGAIAQQKQNISNAISSVGQSGSMMAGYGAGGGGGNAYKTSGSSSPQQNYTSGPTSPMGGQTYYSSGMGNNNDWGGAPAANTWNRWDGQDPSTVNMVYNPSTQTWSSGPSRGGMGGTQFDEYGNPIGR